MRLENGRWLCTWCKAELDIAADKVPVTSLRAEAGHPNRHAVTVDGRDVHVCAETVGAAAY
jgi:hypothetical protein